MTVRNFSQLCEMIDKSKVKLRMTEDTHRYIVGVGGSIDPEKIKVKDLKGEFEGIEVEYDNNYLNKQVEFVPTFKPRIGEGFEIKLV